MQIIEVTGSSEPWFIGRGRGVTFFGRSRIDLFNQYIEWLRVKREEIEAEQPPPPSPPAQVGARSVGVIDDYNLWAELRPVNTTQSMLREAQKNYEAARAQRSAGCHYGMRSNGGACSLDDVARSAVSSLFPNFG